jgi:hypothetical protein
MCSSSLYRLARTLAAKVAKKNSIIAKFRTNRFIGSEVGSQMLQNKFRLMKIKSESSKPLSPIEGEGPDWEFCRPNITVAF